MKHFSKIVKLNGQPDWLGGQQIDESMFSGLMIVSKMSSSTRYMAKTMKTRWMLFYCFVLFFIGMLKLQLVTAFDSMDKLTRIGLRKSKLDRKWLCALFSQSLEDLQIISWVSWETLRSAMWTNSSRGVELQRSLRWKPKPLVSTCAENKDSGLEKIEK